MKIRHKRSSGSDKVELQMTPMIDIVFQLLIFFMLTLKIIEPEGDFNINMPIGAPSQAVNDEINLPDIKVRLIADEDGVMTSLRLGANDLLKKAGGDVDGAFQLLNVGILNLIGRPGNPLTKDIEVEIDADFALHYQYVIRAVSACTGRLQRKPDGTEEVVRYIEKIKFAAPRKEAGAGA